MNMLGTLNSLFCKWWLNSKFSKIQGFKLTHWTHYYKGPGSWIDLQDYILHTYLHCEKFSMWLPHFGLDLLIVGIEIWQLRLSTLDQGTVLEEYIGWNPLQDDAIPNFFPDSIRAFKWGTICNWIVLERWGKSRKHLSPIVRVPIFSSTTVGPEKFGLELLTFRFERFSVLTLFWAGSGITLLDGGGHYGPDGF